MIKLCGDAYNKVNEHAQWNSPVSKQTRKNFGLVRNDNLIRLKVLRLKWNIGNDLNETD